MKNQALIFILGFFVLIGAAFWLLGERAAEERTVPAGKKLSVAVTFYPLEEFARAVGGDLVSVATIVPAGAEPHEYEPTPQNILSAYRADAFLLNGAGLDPWAEKIRPELAGRGVTVVQMSEGIALLSGSEEERDPHFWLDPVFAQKETEMIRDAFIARDAAHEAVYTENAERYLAALRELDAAYRGGLAQCGLDTIVTSHEAFAYLAKRYGFETLSVSGLSPEAEPSPRRLAEIAQTVRDRGIRYIFFETLVSPKVAETLARETGTQTLVFDPLEGLTDEDRAAGKNYLGIMRDNLDNLRTALECQQ